MPDEPTLINVPLSPTEIRMILDELWNLEWDDDDDEYKPKYDALITKLEEFHYEK